jgi:hypothetical protein
MRYINIDPYYEKWVKKQNELGHPCDVEKDVTYTEFLLWLEETIEGLC